MADSLNQRILNGDIDSKEFYNLVNNYHSDNYLEITDINTANERINKAR